MLRYCCDLRTQCKQSKLSASFWSTLRLRVERINVMNGDECKSAHYKAEKTLNELVVHETRMSEQSIIYIENISNIAYRDFEASMVTC